MRSYEIEQKYRCKNLSRFRIKLLHLEARFVKKGAELNEFWDLSGKLAQQKTVLRLRRHGKTSELTLKGPRLKSRYTKRIELETPVEYEPTRAILEALGFKLSREYAKKREVYYLGKVMVTLDTLPKLGSFVELEGSVLDIARAAKKLSLTDKDREEKSYLQMLYAWKG